MSHQVLDSQKPDHAQERASTTSAADAPPPIRRHDIAGVLARMTFRERVNAYEKGVFTFAELNAAAARESHRMPRLNGEFEWIAAFSADIA